MLRADDRPRRPALARPPLWLGGRAIAAVGIVGFAIVRFGWFPTFDTAAGGNEYAEFELASYVQLALAVLVGIGGLSCVIAASIGWRTESGDRVSPPVRQVGAFLVVVSLILVGIALTTGFAGAWDA